MHHFNNFCYDKDVKGVLIEVRYHLLLPRAYYLNSTVVRIG